MEEKDYFKSIDVSITISDTEGNILYMNDKSQSVFGSLVGSNMMGCHKASSQEIIHRLIDQAESNAYTIEKKGVKKLIYQTPWYSDEEKTIVGGLIEFSIILPDDMPHHIRG